MTTPTTSKSIQDSDRGTGFKPVLREETPATSKSIQDSDRGTGFKPVLREEMPATSKPIKDSDRPEQTNGGDAPERPREVLQAIAPDKWPLIAAALGLTARQCLVAQLTCTGAKRTTVAERMGVTVGTVNALTSRVYKKAGCRDRLAFMVRCQEIIGQHSSPPPPDSRRYEG